MQMVSQICRNSCSEYSEPPKFSNFGSSIISTKIIFQIISLLKLNKNTKIRLRGNVIVGPEIRTECDSIIMNLITEAKT